MKYRTVREASLSSNEKGGSFLRAVTFTSASDCLTHCLIAGRLLVYKCQCVAINCYLNHIHIEVIDTYRTSGTCLKLIHLILDFTTLCRPSLSRGTIQNEAFGLKPIVGTSKATGRVSTRVSPQTQKCADDMLII